jgi:hypothetical protein
MLAERAEKLTVEFLNKHDVNINLGEMYSIKCQYAQMENVVNDAAERFATDFIYSLSESFDEGVVDEIKARYLDYKNKSY